MEALLPAFLISLCSTMQHGIAQVCQAYRCDGGTTVVVLTKRPKLEMEAAFRCGVSYMVVLSYR